ncbi:MAG: DUF3471 domain-containing protein [Spirosomaceae bacterium]|jgi:hypothetical protein|nr:DUF3471 domain-containing protein [Spirosomataceae bacterium]
MKKIFFITLFGLLGSVAMAQTTPDSTALKEYAGVYKFSETFTQCTVVYKNGAIWAEVDENGQNKLLPQKDADKFQSTSSYGTVFTFRRNANKVITSVKLELMGQEIIAEKAKP